MASTRTTGRAPATRSLRHLRAIVLVLTAGAVTALAPAPASATPVPAPTPGPVTASQAAELVAARAHDLEALTERYNTAREELETKQVAARAAEDAVARTKDKLTEARQQVRGIARSAYTGSDLTPMQTLLTADSSGEFVRRVTILQAVSGHQTQVLNRAVAAGEAAAGAETTARQAVADAKGTFDAVAAQQAQLQKEINDFTAQYKRLSAQERALAVAAAAAHGGDRTSRDDRPAGATVAPAEASAGPVAAPTQAAQVAVTTALAQRGKPYVWAAAGPGSFDCSGLVLYAFKAAGISLPHSAAMQAGMGTAVSRSQLQPGDLVAYYSPVSHIGIYVGNGQVVHAPTSGDVVKVAGMDNIGPIAALRRIAFG